MYTNHIFSFKSKQSQRKKMNNITIRDAFLKRLVLWNTKGQTTDYKNDGIHCNCYWMKRRGKLFAYEEHTGKFWWLSVTTKTERIELTDETQDDHSQETNSVMYGIYPCRTHP